MKRLSHYLFIVICIVTLAACTSQGGGDTTPWDLAQPSKERQQTARSGNMEPLEPQVDWRQRQNIQTNIRNQSTAAEPPQSGQSVAAPVGAGAKVKVALLVPMSGPHQQIGNALLNAAQLALFDVGSDNFELMPRDTKGTPNGAQNAARAALQDGADLILGPLLSSSVQSIKPVAKAANVPVIAFSTDWKVAGDNTYVMGFLPFAQVARISNFAVDNGNLNIALLAPDGEYTRMVDNMLTNNLRENRGNLVKKRIYAPNATDLSQLVADFTDNARRKASGYKDRNLPFDAIMMPVGGEEVKVLTTFLGHYHVDSNMARLLGTGLWDDPSLTKEPGMMGARFAAPDPKLRRDFEQSYRETYGQTPPRLSSLAYDATALAAILAQNGGNVAPQDVYSKTRLTSSRGFAGIDGIFRFGADGLVERGLAVLEIRKNGITVIDPAPTAFMASRRM